MGKIVLFSAANPRAEINLQSSVVEGVGLAVLASSRMFAALQQRQANGRIHVWGIQPGARGQKIASWRRVDPPAVGFFYTPGGFTVAANLWAKEPPVGRVRDPFGNIWWLQSHATDVSPDADVDGRSRDG